MTSGFMDATLHPNVGLFPTYIILALRDHPQAGTCKFTRTLSPLLEFYSKSGNNIWSHSQIQGFKNYFQLIRYHSSTIPNTTIQSIFPNQEISFDHTPKHRDLKQVYKHPGIWVWKNPFQITQYPLWYPSNSTTMKLITTYSAPKNSTRAVHA